jgi:uracil-DNA glycosylase
MKGFYGKPSWDKIKQPLPLLPECGICGLVDQVEHGQMPPSGYGRRKVLILGEAPGENEDKEGLQFVGRAGQELARLLASIGVSMRRDCWLHNALSCRPADRYGENRKPLAKEIGYCRPNVEKALKDLAPTTIIPMGETAMEALLPLAWKKEKVESISTWVGYDIPCQKLNCWINPTYHPSYLARAKEPVVQLHMTKHVQKAFAHKDRPWPNGVPNYESKVKILLNPDEAIPYIRKFAQSKEWVAFDYECLVPKTKVLTDDFRWVEIGTLKVGDSLTSFEEYPAARKRPWGRRILRGKVISVKRFKAPCVRITMTDGRVIEASDNHPWLTVTGNQGLEWTISCCLKAGDLIRQVTQETWEVDNSRDGGWLARYCKGLSETMKFVGSIRPSRLIENLQKSILGVAYLPKKNPHAVVAKVENIGRREVVGITTDTRTYIAEGLCSHNTNPLKPDISWAEILCCSMSDGTTTIAYPWHGQAIQETSDFLKSPVPKVAANAKFEDRWTRVKLGHGVNNWLGGWDTVMGAAWSNCRSGTKSLKFQAFVLFGIDDYDSYLDSWKKGDDKGGYSPNKLKLAEPRLLLQYCGLDSLFEIMVAKRQQELAQHEQKSRVG